MRDAIVEKFEIRCKLVLDFDPVRIAELEKEAGQTQTEVADEFFGCVQREYPHYLVGDSSQPEARLMCARWFVGHLWTHLYFYARENNMIVRAPRNQATSEAEKL